jgi:hypothetical protein
MKITKAQLKKLIKEELGKVEKEVVSETNHDYDEGNRDTTVANLLRSITLEFYEDATTHMGMFSPEDIVYNILEPKGRLSDGRFHKMLKDAMEREVQTYLKELGIEY